MKILNKLFEKSEQLEIIEYAEVLPPEKQAKKDAEEKAQQAIVTAYNACITKESITADDFAKNLFVDNPTESKITDIVSVFVSCRVLSQFNYGDELTLESFVKNSLNDDTKQKDDVFKLNLTAEEKARINKKATEAKKSPEEILTGEIQFALQVHGVFEALHSQYGNNEIKDNLAKVEKDPTTWEKIKDFINEYLLAGLFQTNVNDKERYKANASEIKQSFVKDELEKRQKQDTVPNL